MSNNGGGEGGALILLLVVGAFLFYVVLHVVVPVLYATFSFAALVLTLISLLAWNRPRRFFHLGIVPMQARAMVSFGIVGAVLAPCFILFMQFLIGVSVAGWMWPHIVLIGYTFGCIETSRSMEFEARNVDHYEAAQYAALLPPPEPSRSLPAPTPFRYAYWTDAEEL